MRKISKTEILKRGVMSRDIFAVPAPIVEDITSKGWVYRWGAWAKFQKQSGTDLRGYVAYRVPEKFKKPLVDKDGVQQYGEDFSMSEDGLFHRGDMVLLVMPKTRRDENRAAIEAENKINREMIKATLENHRGVSLEEAKFETFIPTIKNQLGD